MLRTILAALVFLGVTVGAQASTLTFNVVGTATGTVWGGASYDFASGTPGSGWSLNVADVTVEAQRHAAFLSATTGTATYVPGTSSYGTFTSCGGLLTYLCTGLVNQLEVDLVANTFRLSGYETWNSAFTGDQSQISFGFDRAGISFVQGGIGYYGAGLGLTSLSARLTEVSMIAAPLPAGAWLLLSGLGALAVARRARARRT